MQIDFDMTPKTDDRSRGFRQLREPLEPPPVRKQLDYGRTPNVGVQRQHHLSPCDILHHLVFSFWKMWAVVVPRQILFQQPG